MGELLTDHLAHRAENIAYLAHYRTNLPAPELGDDGESQGASPPPPNSPKPVELFACLVVWILMKTFANMFFKLAEPAIFR